MGVGFVSGRFRAPAHAGVCFMLSSRNVIIMDRKIGRVGAVGPHLMFYAPYAHGAQFGTAPNLGARFLIADEGTPFAMIIVPVASEETPAHDAH